MVIYNKIDVDYVDNILQNKQVYLFKNEIINIRKKKDFWLVSMGQKVTYQWICRILEDRIEFIFQFTPMTIPRIIILYLGVLIWLCSTLGGIKIMIETSTIEIGRLISCILTLAMAIWFWVMARKSSKGYYENILKKFFEEEVLKTLDTDN